MITERSCASLASVDVVGESLVDYVAHHEFIRLYVSQHSSAKRKQDVVSRHEYDKCGKTRIFLQQSNRVTAECFTMKVHGGYTRHAPAALANSYHLYRVSLLIACSFLLHALFC